MRNYQIFVAALIVFSVLLVIISFVVAGNPLSARNQQLDDARLRDFSDITNAINNYYSVYHFLPTTINNLSINNYPPNYRTADPQTNIPYTYKPQSLYNYQLCTTFAQDSKDEPSSSYNYDFKFRHKKGYDCLNFSVPNYYQPSPTPLMPVSYHFTVCPTISDLHNDGCDYYSLSNALNAIPNGGIISLKPGTYQVTDTLLIRNKSVSIDGKDADKTVISASRPILPSIPIYKQLQLSQPQSSNSVRIITPPLDNLSMLETIQVDEGGTLTLSNVSLIDNRQYPAIKLYNNGRLNIFKTKIFNNLAGIEAVDDSSLDILANEITNNLHDGILLNGNVTFTIQNNIIANNGFTGIHMGSTIQGEKIIYNNVLYHNDTTGDHDQLEIAGANADIKNNIIVFGVTKGANVNTSSIKDNTFQYNDVYGNKQAEYLDFTPDDTNLSVDPQFVDAANNNFHLKKTSSLLKKGSDQSDIGAYGGSRACTLDNTFPSCTILEGN